MRIDCDNCKHESLGMNDYPCFICGHYTKWSQQNKDKLILLVGASGSGKTTVSKLLEKQGINIVKSYTTREPREPNEWGHTFVDAYELLHDGIGDTAIAMKEIYGCVYWATKAQYQGKGTSIYVVDPEGAKQVQEALLDDDSVEVITIFLMVDKQIRYGRMMIDGVRSIIKINERVTEDTKIFATCKCDYVVDGNDSVESVAERIMTLIEDGD